MVFCFRLNKEISNVNYKFIFIYSATCSVKYVQEQIQLINQNLKKAHKSAVKLPYEMYKNTIQFDEGAKISQELRKS